MWLRRNYKFSSIIVPSNSNASIFKTVELVNSLNFTPLELRIIFLRTDDPIFCLHPYEPLRSYPIAPGVIKKKL